MGGRAARPHLRHRCVGPADVTGWSPRGPSLLGGNGLMLSSSRLSSLRLSPRRLSSLRRRGRMRTAAAAVVAGTLLAVPGAGGPAQADVLYVPWSAYLSGWTDEYV